MRTVAKKKKDKTGNRKVSRCGFRPGDYVIARSPAIDRARSEFPFSGAASCVFLNSRNWLTLTTTPVAYNTSSEVSHGESWPENPWQTVRKNQYKVQCQG